MVDGRSYVIVMAASYVKMRVWQICVLVFYLLIPNSTYALNCRSDRGAKENEFRRAYNNCVKQVERNSSRHSSEDWKDRDRDYNRRNQWDRNNNNENWNSRDGNRDNDYEDRNRDLDHRDDGKERYDKKQNRENGNENGAKRMSDRYDRTNGRRSRMNMNENNSGSGRNRDGVMNNHGRNDQISGRDEFLQTEDMNSDSTGVQYYNYYPSTQSSRRYKREKRVEINSGQRSQYNPHSQKSNSHDNNFNKMNSSDNSSKEMDKACILHCLLENLHMTDDRGMPDRYLVTHAFIRDEKNEDLQDFIQETIEECFQILDNENTEDKCQFSKDLLTCLTEKGRANCDNWSEKTSYLFE